jgi:hypothetical protein
VETVLYSERWHSNLSNGTDCHSILQNPNTSREMIILHAAKSHNCRKFNLLLAETLQIVLESTKNLTRKFIIETI